MAADGSIVVSVEMDDKKAQKELAKLSAEIKKTETEISTGEAKKSPLIEQAQALEKQIKAARAEAAKYKAEWLAGGTGADREEIAALEKASQLKTELSGVISEIDKIDQSLLPAYSRLEDMQQEAGEIQMRLAQASAAAAPKLVEALGEADAKAEKFAGNVRKSMDSVVPAMEQAGAGAKSFSKQLTASVKKVTPAVNKLKSAFVSFGKRLASTLKSALLFSVLYSGLSKAREYLTSAALASDEFRTALGRVKGALQYAFQPIISAVLPALTSLANGLATAIGWITAFMKAVAGAGGGSTGGASAKLAGMSGATASLASESMESVRALSAESEAIEEVEGAAESASKSLASFDEINKLTGETASGGGGGGGGGGVDAEIPVIEPETIELSGGLAELAERLGSAIGSLKDAISGLVSSATFQQILQWVKDLGAVAAVTVIETLANAVNVLAKAFSLLDKVFSGDLVGAFESFLDLDWAILETLLTPFQNLFEWAMGVVDSLELGEFPDLLARMFAGDWVEGLINLVTGGWFEKFAGGIGLIKVLSEIDLEEWWNTKIAPWFTAERWQQLWNDVKTGVSNGWGSVKAWWDQSALVVWWNSSVIPFFQSEKWRNLWTNVENAFSSGWSAIKSWWDRTALVVWWRESVVPWFETTRWGTTLKNVRAAFTTMWNELIAWWNSSTLVVWWRDNVVPFFDAGTWLSAMSGIATAFSDAFTNAANAAIDVLNRLIYWINQQLRFTIPALEIMGQTLWESRTVTLASIPSIPYLAQGAVIPPNREFMAVLGDQKQGRNIEAPESLIRQIVREETANMGGEQTVILQVDKQTLGEVVYRLNSQQTRRLGVSLAGV